MKGAKYALIHFLKNVYKEANPVKVKCIYLPYNPPTTVFTLI